ncbi:1-deoxy-D-xylulose-5-phosphate synthase [Helicobacter sp. MIT 14-3879]|uniref:1-deoxy-D-xylulose-5-phosphate synthase n=1 Tax=Helicobacter sp. MIT 14-3879 TaxID=2040649 RepID=UPI000E1F7D7F|nr:1-deoxy-D-xylulose-5-phosphate synthase [Helicobacter sp. MIT 14-3879]RDU62292.1 1-deoxy-D-xylulose-5-phosphate synthase [Helicobacter sp. MIT 14-3879]
MNIDELNDLANKIRSRIIDVLSKNGGHLSSNLGSVEITIAMHYIFDCTKDPFIFDVSHQCYTHKLLTGRWESFSTLRQTNGISGFANPRESSSDYFIAGHSSTSLSIGVGVARAIKLNNEDRIPIILIGDGAMSAGLIYEALDEIGYIKYPMIIILNDNEMSISKPIGAMSKYLSTATAGKVYQSLREKLKKFLSIMPDSATYMAKRFEESLKLITPGILFEELGLNYIGPINGHNIAELISIFQKAKDLKKPVLIHTQTIKGYGYKIAEGRYEKWHSVSPFDINTGKALVNKSNINPTSVFANKLLELAKKDEKIVGVTAAMPSGTGLDLLIDNLPNRFFDVAIAEAHATTSMAAMAKEGFKPFVVIYSTFLQRAFDSIIHDVSIMNLPVKFAIDRAGIVGEDGETHQGIFDISYLSLIPNMVIFAPRDYDSLELAISFAAKYNKSPIAFRYPRSSFLLENNTFKNEPFKFKKGEVLQQGKEIALLAFGNGVGRAYLVNKILGFSATLVDLRFAKPLDSDLIIDIAKTHKRIYIFSDGVKFGGLGERISMLLNYNNVSVKIKSFEFDDSFIPHGKISDIEDILCISPIKIAKFIKKDC